MLALFGTACKKTAETVSPSNQLLIDGDFDANNGHSNICITDDGGVAFVTHNRAKQIYVAKVNSALELQWSKTFDSAVNNAGGICASGDGGVIVIGNLFDGTSAKHAISVRKLDNSGNLVWKKKYWFDFPEHEAPVIRKSSDNGFMILICDYYEGQPFPIIPTFFKINSAGDSIWSHWLPGLYRMTENDFQVTPDEGFIVAGRYRILKTDAAGNQVWLKDIQATNPINVKVLTDGSYVALGDTAFETNPPDVNQQDMILVKFDQNGSKLWEIRYNNGFNDFSFNLCLATDGGFLLTGKPDDLHSLSKPVLIKTDNSGIQQSLQELPGIEPIGLVYTQGKYIYVGVLKVATSGYYNLMLYSFQ